MRKIYRLSIVMLASSAASGAMSQVADDNAAVLRRSLPSFELAANPQMEAAFKPYVECYSNAVERSPYSELRDDEEVRSAEKRARERCGTVGASAMTSADLRAATLSPGMSSEERERTLRNVRRQLAIFGLIRRYAKTRRAVVFQSYLERVGRQGRAGRAVEMLTGG